MEYYVICDKKEAMKSAAKRFPKSTFAVCCGPVKTSAALEQSKNVVFYMKNRNLTNAAVQSGALQNKEVFVYPYDLVGVSEPIRIDPSKPRLDYLETEISYRCNLNCRGCCDFCNLETDSGFYDFDTYCRDLSRIGELFWGVEKFRLMGGEPLLNPRLADYAEQARALFPDCDIRIVTNGLLIPALSKNILLRLKTCKVSFDISNYPTTGKIRRRIKQKLADADIGYHFSVPVRFFFKTILANSTDTPERSFGNCIFSRCHMMGNGKLSPCSYAHCISRFNRFFKTDYPEDDYFDLYTQDLNGHIINDAFSRPHAFCRYCAGGMVPIRWRQGVISDRAKKEDWLINDSFFSTTILPGVQSLLKKSAVRLRYFVQDR
ncbi:MAG: radical SAM protein [Clostridia bacterium]|nr:radical SAM protein [Clostridia bacterium]